MIRGTTPTNVFTTNVDLTTATVLYISYEQNDIVVLEKSLSDCTVTATSVSVTLTQADTLAFAGGKKVFIQIRAKFGDGTAVASEIITTTADRIIKDGAI